VGENVSTTVGLAEGDDVGIKVGFWVGASVTMLRSMLLHCVIFGFGRQKRRKDELIRFVLVLSIMREKIEAMVYSPDTHGHTEQTDTYTHRQTPPSPKFWPTYTYIEPPSVTAVALLPSSGRETSLQG
jgi:hypothetical protein